MTTEDYDPAGMFAATSANIYVPSDGIYLAVANTETLCTSFCLTAFDIDGGGSEYGVDQSAYDSYTGATRSSIAMHLQLTAGQYISLQCFNTAASAYNLTKANISVSRISSI